MITFHKQSSPTELGYIESWIATNEGRRIPLDPNGVTIYATDDQCLYAVAHLDSTNRLHLYFDNNGTIHKTFRCFSHFESFFRMLGIFPVILVADNSPLLEYCDRVMTRISNAFEFKGV